jgi:hypothetical protein
MINHPDHTTDAEILAISKAFKIPVARIEDALRQEAAPKKKAKKEPTGNKIIPLKFSDFEEEYINAHDSDEEIAAIKKFVTVCVNTKQAKYLYELCPENQVPLKNDILYKWVEVSQSMADIREVKPLTEKGTPAGDLAYRKYIDFF